MPRAPSIAREPWARWLMCLETSWVAEARLAAPSRGLIRDGFESTSNVGFALERWDARYRPALYLGRNHLRDAAAFSVRLRSFGSGFRLHLISCDDRRDGARLGHHPAKGSWRKRVEGNPGLCSGRQPAVLLAVSVVRASDCRFLLRAGPAIHTLGSFVDFLAFRVSYRSVQHFASGAGIPEGCDHRFDDVCRRFAYNIRHGSEWDERLVSNRRGPDDESRECGGISFRSAIYSSAAFQPQGYGTDYHLWLADHGVKDPLAHLYQCGCDLDNRQATRKGVARRLQRRSFPCMLADGQGGRHYQSSGPARVREHSERTRAGRGEFSQGGQDPDCHLGTCVLGHVKHCHGDHRRLPRRQVVAGRPAVADYCLGGAAAHGAQPDDARLGGIRSVGRKPFDRGGRRRRDDVILLYRRVLGAGGGEPGLGGDISAGIRPQSGPDGQDRWGRVLGSPEVCAMAGPGRDGDVRGRGVEPESDDGRGPVAGRQDGATDRCRSRRLRFGDAAGEPARRRRDPRAGQSVSPLRAEPRDFCGWNASDAGTD